MCLFLQAKEAERPSERSLVHISSLSPLLIHCSSASIKTTSPTSGAPCRHPTYPFEDANPHLTHQNPSKTRA